MMRGRIEGIRGVPVETDVPLINGELPSEVTIEDLVTVRWGDTPVSGVLTVPLAGIEDGVAVYRRPA